MVNINGIAHVQLSVSDMSRSVPFYRRLLNSMSLQTIMDEDDFLYCVGGRTGVAIAPVAPEFEDSAFDQRRVGLHHVCFRARSREDVDAIHAVALEIGAKIVHPPEDGRFAPGYYSVLFEDPDGIRIEANFVPGKGHLEEGVELPLKVRGGG
ncbi:MAG: VOC family protein [Myxococcales bacterium]|nr:VOC family protein [Myxococcales bacterium]